MAEITEKLSDEQKDELVSNFKKDIGSRLQGKRKRIGISQEELARCLSVSGSALSRYENGSLDMPVSFIPLYSAYCDFEIPELFPRDEMHRLIRSVRSSITVMVGKSVRKRQGKGISTDKALTARIYMQDGKEVREEVRQRPKTQRDSYKEAQAPVQAEPFSEQEFCEYLSGFDDEIREALCKAGDFLGQIMDEPRKDTLRGAVADYIIDTAIIDRVCRKDADIASLRAYAYYKRLMEQTGGDGFDVADRRDL